MPQHQSSPSRYPRGFRMFTSPATTLMALERYPTWQPEVHTPTDVRGRSSRRSLLQSRPHPGHQHALQIHFEVFPSPSCLRHEAGACRFPAAEAGIAVVPAPDLERTDGRLPR